MAERRTQKPKPAVKTIYLAYSALGLLLIYLVATQRQELADGVKAIKNADLSLVGLSLVFQLGTYLSAALVYYFISIRRVPYSRTLLVQIGSSFTNRLLPAGTGRLATFGRYLIKQGHTTQQAAALLAVNNLMGFIGLMILTLGAALASQTPVSEALSYPIPAWLILVLLGAAATIILTASLYQPLLNRTKKAARVAVADFKLISASPIRLLAGLLSSMMITICFWAILYVTIIALGQSATILQTFIVMTVGVAAASITPTPGGVGGAEAGLVAALTAIDINTEAAISIALVYRIITFWLPIIPGFICFRVALRRRIL
jgi:uncharacterized protein (TIRG00374 family)